MLIAPATFAGRCITTLPPSRASRASQALRQSG
jgi:hypothetical protein